MRGWALTTAVLAGSRYAGDIAPLTWPLMQAYAERWEMDWCPYVGTEDDIKEFGGSPAPHGTAVTYAHIPHWQRLMESHKGVCFIDCDAVIVDPTYDLCREVSDNVPMAATVLGDIVNCGVVAMRSSGHTKDFLAEVWRTRHRFANFQWLEQAAFNELLGWDPHYPGDGMPGCYLYDTDWTPYFTILSEQWNALSRREVDNPLIRHAAGVQPYEARLELVRRWVDEVNQTRVS
jgi:hypothetical protein